MTPQDRLRRIAKWYSGVDRPELTPENVACMAGADALDLITRVAEIEDPGGFVGCGP